MRFIDLMNICKIITTSDDLKGNVLPYTKISDINFSENEEKTKVFLTIKYYDVILEKSAVLQLELELHENKQCEKEIDRFLTENKDIIETFKERHKNSPTFIRKEGEIN